MCERIISEDPFSIRYAPDQNKTQRMCDEAVDDCLTLLKFVSDWLVTSKTIKILFTAFYADNINLVDTNYDEDDPDTITLSDFWLGILNLKNVKHFKTVKLRTPVAWLPKIWWKFCMSEDTKKDKN